VDIAIGIDRLGSVSTG